METIKIKDYPVKIYLEDWTENPREWADSSTLCTAHRNYGFGGVALSHTCTSLHDAFRHHLQDEGLTERDIICCDVYLYEHSGIALSTAPFSCSWDSGQLGYIYEKRSDIRAEFDVKRISPQLEQIIFDRLDSEIETLGYWANGEVYYYEVEGEICGGFFGSDHEASGLIESATDTINWLRREKVRKHTANLKRLIKSGVNLQYRPPLSLATV